MASSETRRDASIIERYRRNVFFCVIERARQAIKALSTRIGVSTVHLWSMFLKSRGEPRIVQVARRLNSGCCSQATPENSAAMRFTQKNGAQPKNLHPVQSFVMRAVHDASRASVPPAMHLVIDAAAAVVEFDRLVADA